MVDLVKSGIVLFVISLFVIYLSSASFEGSFTGSNLQELSVLPHNTTYASFTLPNVTIVGFFFYTNGSAVNFLLLNQSGFSSIAAQLNSTAQINESRLIGDGALEMSYNSVYGVFPYQSINGTLAAQTYASNSSPALPAGSYYAVFQNQGSSSIKIFYSAILKTQAQINGTIFSSAAYGITGAALFFSGIVIILYSILAKSKKEDQQTLQTDDDVEKLYTRQKRPRRKRKARK